MRKDKLDGGFENYRRERQRHRRNEAERLAPPRVNALKELEEVEQREERDRQLGREVHEFFESATRTAASIVRKVADTAKEEVDSKLSGEMEEFLIDSLSRMQDLIVAVVAKNHGPVAQQTVEPTMRNIVGQLLDSFRNAGTAGVNKHLGEDPGATNLDDVRREFSERMPKGGKGDAIVPVQAGADQPKSDAPGIEDHLVAHVQPAPPEPPAPAESGRDQGSNGPRPALDPSQAAELAGFKDTLKKLVRQGKMTKDEARNAWEARVRRGQ